MLRGSWCLRRDVNQLARMHLMLGMPKGIFIEVRAQTGHLEVGERLVRWPEVDSGMFQVNSGGKPEEEIHSQANRRHGGERENIHPLGVFRQARAAQEGKNNQHLLRTVEGGTRGVYQAFDRDPNSATFLGCKTARVDQRNRRSGVHNNNLWLTMTPHKDSQLAFRTRNRVRVSANGIDEVDVGGKV